MSEEKVFVTLDQLQSSLDTFGTKMADIVDKKTAEIRAKGGPSGETEKQFKEVEQQILDLKTEQKELMDVALKELKENYDSQTGTITRLEKELARLGVEGIGGESAERYEGIASQITKSKKFEDHFGGSKVDDFSGNVTFSIKANAREFQNWNDLSRFITPISGHPYQPDGTLRPRPGFGVTQDGALPFLEEPLFFESIVPTRSVADPVIEYIQQKRFGVELVAKIVSASSTVADIELDNANGFYDAQKVSVQVTDGSYLQAVVQSVDYDTNTITLTGPLATATMLNGEVQSNSFGKHFTGELKPEFKIMPPELKYAYVSDFATTHVIPRQLLRDVPGFQQELEQGMVQAMRRNREVHLMYGTGGERSLQGILTHPDRQQMSLTEIRAVYGATQTVIDALHRAITRTQISYLPATTIIMHPLDWQEIALLKGSDLKYIWIPQNEGFPVRAPNVRNVWQLPVILSQTINEGQVFVGNMNEAIQMYRRGGMEVSIFDQHSDFAARNMLLLRAEESIGVAHKRPQALVDLNIVV